MRKPSPTNLVMMKGGDMDNLTKNELFELLVCVEFMIYTSKNRLKHFNFSPSQKKTEEKTLEDRVIILEKLRKM